MTQQQLLTPLLVRWFLQWHYSYRTAGWRPVQFCNKTQDLEHWVKVAGDLSALKVTTGDLNFLMQTFLSAFQEIPDTHFNFHDMIVSKTYNVEQSTQIILQIGWVCRDIHNWWSSLRVLMKSDNSICIKYSIRTRNYVIVLITFC